MGKITREELANSLNDHIESQSKNKQNKTDDSLKTSDKTIVGAINELYQDINDGKQIIADAINNDSITKDSAFEAMGEAIRGLSTKVNNLTNELAGKVTPAGTAIANDVLSGKTFINNTGHIITGTIANRGGAQTVTPGTSNKTLSAGYYSGNITVAGDANLVAANIVSGKNIFGVAGSAQTATALTTAAGTSKELVFQKSLSRHDAIIGSSFYYYADEYNDSPYFDLGFGCYINGSATIIMAFNVVKGSQLGYSSHIMFKFTNIATNVSIIRSFSGKKGDGSNISFNITDIPAGIYKIQLSYSPSSDYNGTYEFYLNYFSVCYS